MSRFRNPLQALDVYRALTEKLRRREGPVLVSGLADAAKGQFAEALGDEKYPLKLLVSYDEVRARELQEDLQSFGADALLYPAKDLLFFAADVRSNELSALRIDIRRRIAESGSGFVVTTIDGLMDKLEAPERFLRRCLRITASDRLQLSETVKELSALGYERTAEVDGRGQFSVRGGILDVFPVTGDAPVRIELWDDEIDSMRYFDAETQRSTEPAEEIRIYPAQEELLGGSDSFLRYFSGDNSLLILDEPARLRERAREVEREYLESAEGKAETQQAAEAIVTADLLFEDLQSSRTVCLAGLDTRLPDFKIRSEFSIAAKSVASFPGNFDLLLEDLRRYRRERWAVILMTPSRTRARRLAENLRSYELSAYCSDEDTDELPVAEPGSILLLQGKLHRGFEYPLLRFALLAESDLFGRRKEKKSRKRKAEQAGSRISALSELAVGDYVVHEENGLGIYRGVEKIETDGVARDYIKIEYKDGDNFYVPATRLDAIQKYASAEAVVPKLNRLGSPEWSRTKTRVKRAVREIAKELVTLYVARLKEKGHRYGPDTVWQTEFEELFPYAETGDQLQAIADVKEDLEEGKIMDRLVCGDVGYGKTEIALRAAFKVVQEGYQVIFLVPTTILAQQHYNNFSQRLKDFPVRIDLLCRFRSAAEQKKTLADFSRGTVDILIGTHRVLSKDIKPHKLGLLIIDEEQRFGVSHKEKVKQLRKDVNVLTLSATPIPRTLHMSLAGIRELSVLSEPPQDRQPVQTYVMEQSPAIVREAVQRELNRGGQVYYVCNKISRLPEIAAQLAAELPDAEVTYAHGKMQERELERIMLDFMNGEIDVLVTTTIIETGLDIPNVNTIIIEQADRFGLSQLYQLRGRVGRSSRIGYAFLLYQRGKLLREEAEKRLRAIREFTELGSGIRIAMRDLEIRGAGNVLGAEQHGHMQAVGYDLYCKLLNQAVRRLTGQEAEEEEETVRATVEAEASAYIPDSYVKSEEQKLDLYQRIALIQNEEDEREMQDELIDRFGDMPIEVTNLLLIARIRAAAEKVRASEVKVKRESTRITMAETAVLDTEKLPGLLSDYAGHLSVRPARPVEFLLTKQSTRRAEDAMLRETLALFQRFEALLPEKTTLDIDNREEPRYKGKE